MTKHLVPAKEDLRGYGEAMLALSERERRFVAALVDFGGQRGSIRAAAKIAGFGEKSDDHVVDSLASKLLSDDRIISALEEHARKLLKSEAPAAVNAVRELIRSPMHKDHWKAVNALLSRLSPEVQHTQTDINVTHKIDHNAEAVAQLRLLKSMGVARQQLEELFGFGGLQKFEQLIAIEDQKSKVIDATFTEVQSDPDEAELGEL